MMDETPQEMRNRRFVEYKARHPGATYAQWLHDAAVIHVKQGRAHATLGSNLSKGEWWEAGRGTFERYLRLAGIQPDTKVADYGCGSLRVGGHLIRYLEPDRYYGLDVTTALIESGQELVGPELLAQKRPRFGAIEPKALKSAAAFGANCVISTAVCYHVHPDEAPVYFGNLRQLAAKPGARLLFDAVISDGPSAESALAMPIDYYKQALAPLEFVNFHVSAKRESETVGVLEFHLPPKAARKTERAKKKAAK
jgi:SAM-dependent methyltransferase